MTTEEKKKGEKRRKRGGEQRRRREERGSTEEVGEERRGELEWAVARAVIIPVAGAPHAPRRLIYTPAPSRCPFVPALCPSGPPAQTEAVMNSPGET